MPSWPALRGKVVAFRRREGVPCSSRSSKSEILVYSSGVYFQESNRDADDADFKAAEFLKLFIPTQHRIGVKVTSYADVGCGAGALTAKIVSGLRDAGLDLETAAGYDVSPHVARLGHESARFVNVDFLPLRRTG